jgi:tetratricopeptide (TPR) repeat protein
MVKEATARRYARSSELLASDVGKRIRQARLARGLSLAQVGGEDLSRSFLSAVESGRSRISLRALQIVANRLDKPMSAFLDDAIAASDVGVELLLDQAEIALRADKPQEAQRFLADIDAPESLKARALWLQGWMLRALVRPLDAVPLLRESVSLTEGTGDPRQLVLVLYALASALYTSHSYDEARQSYEKALAIAMDQLDDPALQGRLIVCLGHLYYVKGQLDSAMGYYDRARQLLEPVEDLDNLASIYSGLSRICEQRKDFANALRYSRMSLGIHELKHNRREAARELNKMADCRRDLGQLDTALEDSTRAIAWAQEGAAPDVEMIAHSTRAAIYLQRGDLAQAKEEADRVEALTGEELSLARIKAWTVRARVAQRESDYATSDRFYQQALEALDKLGHRAEHADTALAYSLALEQRGDTAAALKFALQAAGARTARFG